MTVYRCLDCTCLHGWSRHPAVLPVRRHHRYPLEDVWYCPGCGTEHRTTDGSALGQVYKRWEAVADVDEAIAGDHARARWASWH